LIEKELTFMGRLLENPAHPFVAVMGGAKVSDKLGVIQNILDKVDSLLIGGGMAANFLKAQGYGVGVSAVEEDKLDYTKGLLAKVQLEAGVSCRVVSVEDIPAGWVIADIGPDTTERFVQEIGRSKTAFWNGPMGVFEIEPLAEGTRAIARALAESKATTIVGGGSTAEAVEEMKLADKMSHVSTGGGASLKFLEGGELPGVTVLQDK
jgi:phosphoglycerate kinase